MAPPRTCECGACRKCKRREYMREWYAENSDKVKGWVRSYRQTNPEKLRTYEAGRNREPERRQAGRDRTRGSRQRARDEWNAQHPESGRASKSLWKRRNPEKVRAHSLLAYYIRTGQIQRAPCEVCGSGRSEGHHEDYAKPREVRWLCRKHHAREHWLPLEISRGAD